ncbi:MAG: hypothetical protein YK1309IOTA_660015 [Marine Group I thaumarchaeote]|nr:MAG: hypothetical protein YK1309IOTA_660015 [Marine Group I thaumarchaeote]
MTSQSIWIGITIAVFFVGVGASYAIFSSTFDPNTMKFQNQQLFDQMMSQNPKMTKQWMESTILDNPELIKSQEHVKAMMDDPEIHEKLMQVMLESEVHNKQMLEDMMADPVLRHQLIQGTTEVMMEHPDFRTHLSEHMIENEQFMEDMISFMMQDALQWLIDEDILNIPQVPIDIKKLTYEVKGIEKLTTNPLIRQALISSNQEFNEIDNVYLFIDKKDEEWVSVEWDTITPFMSELIQNDVSDLLRQSASFYEEDNGYVVYAEIFVTNAYGANVAQTGKTSDYRQDDESWWQKAKQDMIHITPIEFDESARVYSADICLRIDDQDGNFLGIIKAVTIVDRIIEPEA